MTNRRSRSQYRTEMTENKRKKQDRILNILIAIVSVLIVIKFIFILSENNETVDKKMDNQKEEQAVEDKQTEKDKKQEEQGSDEKIKNEEKNLDENTTEQQENVSITKVENDEFVEEIIENPNWTAIPTNQTGEHVSTYQKGHIDYEEKLQAIRSAVNLDEENIIYWSVKNNGSSDTAISIISSKDKSEKYRVSIQWIESEGWKPVKVEKLKKLEGLF